MNVEKTIEKVAITTTVDESRFVITLTEDETRMLRRVLGSSSWSGLIKDIGNSYPGLSANVLDEHADFKSKLFSKLITKVGYSP